MAQITLNIPDGSASRIVDAFAAEFSYDASSGLTKAQFTKQQVIEYLRHVTKNYEARLAANQSKTTIDSEIDNIGIS